MPGQHLRQGWGRVEEGNHHTYGVVLVRGRGLVYGSLSKTLSALAPHHTSHSQGFEWGLQDTGHTSLQTTLQCEPHIERNQGVRHAR